MKQRGYLLVTWFHIRPRKVLRLEKIRHDKPDSYRTRRGLWIHSKKRLLQLTACLTEPGPLCRLLFSDAGKEQKLCWLLCSFLHSSSLYSFIFISHSFRDATISSSVSSWDNRVELVREEKVCCSRNKPCFIQVSARWAKRRAKTFNKRSEGHGDW